MVWGGASQSSFNGASLQAAPNSAASGIARKVDRAVVDIDVTLGYQTDTAAGTGIVLTSTGEVLTNNHVINGATALQVHDIGNGRTYKATVLGYAPSGDDALLKLQGASHLATVHLGNSSKLKADAAVVAIGNAGGNGGTPSAASGKVTALNQSITASDPGGATSEQLTGLIETNAASVPGDSGGPLVNPSGQVVGINVAASNGFVFGGSDATQGYAIPINTTKALAQQIARGQASLTVHIGSTAFLRQSFRTAGLRPYRFLL